LDDAGEPLTNPRETECQSTDNGCVFYKFNGIFQGLKANYAFGALKVHGLND
jgi:hypothetical protein